MIPITTRLQEQLDISRDQDHLTFEMYVLFNEIVNHVIAENFDIEELSEDMINDAIVCMANKALKAESDDMYMFLYKTAWGNFLEAVSSH